MLTHPPHVKISQILKTEISGNLKKNISELKIDNAEGKR